MSTTRENTIRRIEASGLLDSAWYLRQYRDVADSGLSAAEHYVDIGAALGRNPSPGFDTAYYLRTHRDVAAAGMNPLLHYVAHGRREGRACRPPAHSAATLRQRVVAGAKTHDAARKTILVSAHLARRELYGGERSLLDILEGLAASHNVIVTTPGGSGAYLEALRAHCIEVVSFRCGWWRKGAQVDDLAIAQYCRLIARHDVAAVHANTIMLREPLLAARRMGVPVAVHARELISHDRQLCGVIGEAPERIIQQVRASSDWIIANSEATARCYGDGPRTEIVANTVDMARMDVDSILSGAHVRIALISNNLAKKGIDDMVAVAALLSDRVPGAELLLIGPENDHIRRLRREQADGLIPANLVFAGYREDPAAAIAEADIVLNLSNFRESFGRTILEAMAARRPVVVYDWGALPELVVDGQTGFVVPFRDTAAVADRIAELCGDPARMRAMGEAGRDRALAYYGKDAYAARLEALYRRILDPANRPAAARMCLPARDAALTQAVHEPLRIAYVLWHFPVPSETFVLNELRLLVAQGHDVRVFCRESPHPGFVPDFPITWQRVDGAAELARQLRDSARTVVHAHFAYPTVTELVWPACELAGIPFTFIAHAQDLFRHACDEKNQIGLVGRSPLCLKVLVPSRFHRDHVESRGVPAAKIMINPNGIDPDLYRGVIDPQRAARERRRICAVHRFTEKKGIEALIRACKDLSRDGIGLDIYGYGPLEPHYRQIIETERLDNVLLHGPVTGREELLAIFRAHDLFACPSLRARDGDMDGIPTVIMEAMASGLPVLASGISGLPDLVRDGVTGIVCEPTPDGIAEAVRRYYALDDDTVEAMAEAAQALVRREFAIAPLTANLLRLWQRRTLDLMIVSWNNLPQLREVIRRLRKFTALPFHLVVCDNGSDADVLAYLSGLHATCDNVTVVLNRENAFVGPGTNICMQQGTSDCAIYVCGKEGFVLDHGWDTSLVHYMDTHPQVGMAGTLGYSPDYRVGAQYPVAIPEFPRFRNPQFATENAQREFAHVQGGFFAIRRSMYDAIGGFSDAVPHNYTDVEYSHYAESRGWALGNAPRLLSLYHKTRPGLLARLDETIAASHPPRLTDLRLLDRIADRSVVLCNLCGWHGDAFAMEHEVPACPQCGSVPADRTLYRFLAESALTFRRLDAFGVDIGAPMAAIWQVHFGQAPATSTEARARLREDGRLPFDTGSLALMYLNSMLDGNADDAQVLHEAARGLAVDGLCLIRPEARGTGHSGAHLIDLGAAAGLRVETLRYASSVLHYDPRPLYLCRRQEGFECGS